MTANQGLCQVVDLKVAERKGNFYFVHQFDCTLYQKLISVESQSLVNLVSAGAELRETLEYFQRQAVPIELMPEFQCEIHSRKMARIIDYENFFGRHLELGVDKKLFGKVRCVGNSFHHSPDPCNSSLPPRTYETLLIGLKSMQQLLFEYYKKKSPEAFAGAHIEYNHKSQPINGYWICSNIKTADSTACERQVLCCRPDNRDPELLHYCLLRQYRAADMTEGALRDEKVLRSLWHQGLKKPRNIVRYSIMDVNYGGEEKEKEKKFLLYYDFGGDRPCSLDADMAEKLTIEQKLMILYDMANGVNELHRAGIYHRNLQPNSVYVFFDCRSALVEAKLVGFEYAKIAGDSATVFKDIQNLHGNSSAYFSATMLAVLRQPEASDRVNWASEDIYSLGALFHLLLTGKPPNRGRISSDLTKRTCPEIAKLVQHMLCQRMDGRPEIAYVCNILEPMYNRIREKY